MLKYQWIQTHFRSCVTWVSNQLFSWQDWNWMGIDCDAKAVKNPLASIYKVHSRLLMRDIFICGITSAKTNTYESIEAVHTNNL